MTIKDLPQETPRAWEDFQQFLAGLLQTGELQNIKELFIRLPFELQFGAFVGYFKEQGLDVDVPQWDLEMLKVTICETFRLHENMMGHFS